MAKKLLSPETLGEIVVPANPQLSPDSRYLAFTATKPLIEENRYHDEIRVIETTSLKEIARIQHEGIVSHNWGPGGLAVLSRQCSRDRGDEKQHTCLYVYTPREPTARLVAKLPFTSYAARLVDEKTVALLSVVEKKSDPVGDYVLTNGLPLWSNGAGLVAERRLHVAAVDVETGNYWWLTEGEYDVINAAPTSDNRLVVVATPSRLKPYIQEVRVVDLSGNQETLIHADEGWSISSAALTPDGLLLWGHRRSRGESSHTHVWIIRGADPVCLSCSLGLDTAPSVQSDTFWLRGSPTWPQWSTRGVYFLANRGGRLGLYTSSPSSGVRQVLGGERAIYGFTVNKAGDIVALVYSEPTTPGEVSLYVDGVGERRVTTFSEWLKQRYVLVEPRRIQVQASDGETIEGWYIEPPPGAGEPPYPVVLHIHGGPKSSYGPFFVFQHQLLAAKGFYVVYSNPRGSSGYSEDFADIRCHYGERDYQDIMEFLDAFIEESRGRSDPERIAVTGISYGGFMTNWIIGHTDRFAAAISENGISWWMSDYYTSDIGYWFNPDQICGKPLENPENYWRQSPLRYVDNIKTPLMIIHSMEDYRCYIDQALSLHTELVLRGRESRLVVFKRGDHGFSVRGEPRLRVKRLNLLISFLKEKLVSEKKAREG
jgi:acylaminoacyl-peptidase